MQMEHHNSYKNRLESWHCGNYIYLYIFFIFTCPATNNCGLLQINSHRASHNEAMRLYHFFFSFFILTQTHEIIQCKLDWSDTKVWEWQRQNEKRQKEEQRQRETRENKDSNMATKKNHLLKSSQDFCQQLKNAKQNQTDLLCLNSQLNIILTKHKCRHNSQYSMPTRDFLLSAALFITTESDEVRLKLGFSICFH